MDPFDDAIQRLQGELDNLRQLRPQIKGNGNGGGNGDEWEPPPLPPRNPNLNIAGIEVTQAIQFFTRNELFGPFGPDNSIPLVPKKITVIRVYVDRKLEDLSNPNFPLPSNLTGRCEVWRRTWVPPHDGVEGGYRSVLIDTLSPINIGQTIVAQGAHEIDRNNVNHTLNFRLPAHLCTGHLRLSVEVFDPSHLPGQPNWQRFASPAFSSEVDFRWVPGIDPGIGGPLLRLFVVPIIYTGLDANGNPTRINAPSQEEVMETLSNSFVSQTFPTSGIDYVSLLPAEFNGDLRLGGSGCGAGWAALLDMLRTKRAASSPWDVILGLLPAPQRLDPLGPLPPQVPRNQFGGCGGNGVAAAFVRDQVTVAHELGHAYGRQHAPCGPQANVDTSYPNYNFPMLPNGTIGETGFDTRSATTVLSPSNTKDFMTACAPTWVSTYTYQGLYNTLYSGTHITASLRDNPSGAAPAATLETSVERQYLYLNFRMHRDGRVELLPSFHFSGVSPGPESEDGHQSSVVFELRDASGKVIGFHRCYLTDPYVDPDSPYHDFHEMVPWESETTSIAFLRDGDEMQTIEVEERAPQIPSRPVAERAGDRVRLAWEAQHDQNRITYIVRYSNDGGNTWLAVAVGLAEPRFVADLAHLPGGEQCVFQIVASSTIRTTVAETDPFSAPVKPRRPHIVSPEPDSTFLQGESVVLGGVGYSPDFQSAPFDEVVWTSNVDGFLGYGYEVIPHTLTTGLHKITLGVADGLGSEASASLLIKIQPNE